MLLRRVQDQVSILHTALVRVLGEGQLCYTAPMEMVVQYLESLYTQPQLNRCSHFKGWEDTNVKTSDSRARTQCLPKATMTKTTTMTITTSNMLFKQKITKAGHRPCLSVVSAFLSFTHDSVCSTRNSWNTWWTLMYSRDFQPVSSNSTSTWNE